MGQIATEHLGLVAPELRGALEVFPDIDLESGLDQYRGTAVSDQILAATAPELEVVTREQVFIPGTKGSPDVRVLIYRPPGTTSAPRPAVLNIHGGGYVLGAPEQNDPLNRATALALGCTVVAPSYRLAPETVWPGALEDCWAALEWMHMHASTLGIDPNRIALSGESAGGGHAASLALYARDKSGPPLCLQVLDAPMLDDRSSCLPDPHPYVGRFVWTAEQNRFGWRALLGVEPGAESVPAGSVPAREPDLRGLPPTFITVGSLDLFLEENLEFARRLTRAGVQTELHVIPGAYHGFGIAKGAPQVKQAAELRLEALRRAFEAC